MANIVNNSSYLLRRYERKFNLLFQDTIITHVIIYCILLSVFLVAMLFGVKFRTVRIYNWNGNRFCYLGRAGIRHNGGGYQVRFKERLADLSYTTLYQICPSKRFVRKNKYADIMLCAGNARCLLHVDEYMRQSIYYR